MIKLKKNNKNVLILKFIDICEVLKENIKMRIYIITKGIFSDYHICAVTTNYEEALKLRDIYDGKYSRANIEIYEDGKNNEDTVYGFEYDPNDNSVYFQEYVDYDLILNEDCIWVMAKDKEHALKKAQDMLAMYKANKENIV